MPDGPYNLWKGGETSRRVKDLAGAFAQLPHLPKMLKSQAIVETLVEGCVQGTFVLKLARPDRTFRTWWRTRPDDPALADPAMELVLPEAAELAEVTGSLLAPGVLPDLWPGDEITVQSVIDYFDGTKVLQVDKGGFTEAMPVPKTPAAVVEAAIGEAVSQGKIWLLSPPASLLSEPIPPGVLGPAATLRVPPAIISATAILPENLPAAWTDNSTSGLAIATALSQQDGRTLPWKTVRDVIGAALQARFIALAEGSASWPCEMATASALKLKLPEQVPGTPGHGGVPGGWVGVAAESKTAVAETELDAVQLQDLSDLIPELLEIKNQANLPLTFRVRIEFGDAQNAPSLEAAAAINQLLERVKKGFNLQ